MLLGSATLVAVALLVTAGTSSPIITDILYGTKSAVDISFYAKTTVPLGILIGFLTGVGQLLWWNRSDRSAFFKSLVMPGVAALAATAALVLVGLDDLLVGLFVASALFALFANLSVAFRIFKGNPKYTGGAIAHIGVAIMFVGFVASTEYDQQQTLSLREGEPVDALGFTLTYEGYKPIDNEKFAFQVRVEKDGRVLTAAPVMYYSSYNDGLIRNPDILNFYTKDFYLAPLALETDKNSATDAVEESALRQGESTTLHGVDVAFLGLDRPIVQKASISAGSGDPLGARLLVGYSGRQQVIQIPFALERGEVVGGDPVAVNDRIELTVVGASDGGGSGEEQMVMLRAVDVLLASQDQNEPARDILVVEASVKPWINLVWSGVIILLVGFMVTVVRRAQEAARRTA